MSVRILPLALTIVILSSRCAVAQTLYEQPALVVDPGKHTANIHAVATDAAGQFLVTGSDDKTVRIWSSSEGTLLRTIRIPAGPGHSGRIYAVAMSPDGATVAAGGFTQVDLETAIYLFDRSSGTMTARIGALPEATNGLAFSKDGRFLAAILAGVPDAQTMPGYGHGLRVFDRDKNWSEAFRDTTYGDQGHGVDFATDGRLATSSFDGKVRLYDPNFKMIATQDVLSTGHPGRVAFSPNGQALAVGFDDSSTVKILDGHSLESMPGPETFPWGSLFSVAWSQDGQTLFASGGIYDDDTGNFFVLAWDHSGMGKSHSFSAKCAAHDDATRGLLTMPTGELLVLKANPCLTMLKPDGNVLWTVSPPGGVRDYPISVSADGTIVDFSFAPYGHSSLLYGLGRHSTLRFDLRTMTLSELADADARLGANSTNGVTRGPVQHKLGIQKPIQSSEYDSFAIHPDGSRFVLGDSHSLRALDMDGNELWHRPLPGVAWAVNVTSDGRLAVAAYADGTIRWHRMDDGRELLALQVLSDKKNWVAWTPEGFYGATPGAYGVLRWHVNHGVNAAADSVPISQIPRLKRPDALQLVLQELETARALGIADIIAARIDVQEVTGAAKAPGARLHILAIGINDYGDKATNLRLNFAAKDANDVASALVATQGSEFNTKGGLYAEVKRQYLHDREADRASILKALGSIKANMENDTSEQDLAVILFSGHGVIIDDSLYLLPYGVDARTPASLKASAISANEFHDVIADLAKHGRVLVLMDACHSGAITDDGSTLTSNADLLRLAISASNVTVLTSSKANEFSREDEKWSNGAFTKVLLQALGKDADENHDGLISMSELTRYVDIHLTSLTDGQQHLGVYQRFEGELFIASQ